MTAANVRPQRPPAACDDGLFPGDRHLSLCLWTGLFVGGASILVSLGVGRLPSGRLLNDPIMLALSLMSMMRGLLYFDWISFLIPLGHAVGLGMISWLVLRGLAKRAGRQLRPQEATHAARIALIVSMIPIFLQRIDAAQVLLWYAMSGLLSLLIAGLVANWGAKLLDNVG